MNVYPATPARHAHEWAASDTPGAYACTDCPATAHQCGTCRRILEHDGRICDDCVGRARLDLYEIRDLYRALPDVIAAAAGLHAVRYDRGGGGKPKRAADTQIIGGAAMVMSAGGATYTHLAPGETTDAIATLLQAERLDPPSVLAVLCEWEDAWRVERGEPGADATSVDAAVHYLTAHTVWAAQTSDRWGEYRAAILALRGRLRVLSGDSRAPVEAGVPCPYCAGHVIQVWLDVIPGRPGSGGLDDVRRCDRCALTWESEAHFLLAIREAHRTLPETRPDELVTLEDAKRIYKGRIRPALLDGWVTRGALRPAQREDGRPRMDARGLTLYRLGTIDLAVTTNAEAAS